MSRCWHCGGEIEFRYIDGKLTPIHLSGGWCQGSQDGDQYTKVEVTPFEQRFEDVCRPTHCPQCGESVFYLTHNGGSVWLDELGWPWPKHACFNHQPAPKWLSYFRKMQEQQAKRTGTFGIVQKARWFPAEGEVPTHIAMAIDAGEHGRICIATSGTNSADYVLGRVVSFDLDDASIITSNHEVRPILKIPIKPALLNLPEHWASIPYPKSFKENESDVDLKARSGLKKEPQSQEERLLNRIEELLASQKGQRKQHDYRHSSHWICTELDMQFSKLQRLSPQSISLNLRRRVHEFKCKHCQR